MGVTAPICPSSALAAGFWSHGRLADCPVIDMHGHMGAVGGIWFPRGEAASMIQSMDDAGVRLLVFAPHASLFCPDVGNRAAVEAVRRFPDRLRAYLSVNPHYPEDVERDLAAFDAQRDVFVGLKLLASYHGVPITEEPYRRALEFANERGLPVLMHTWGGDRCCGEVQVRQVAERYPRAQLLLGHSLNGKWEEAAELARAFPHVWLELTAVLGFHGILELFAERGCGRRMLFGTDLPWFSPYHGIGAVLSADITDDDRRDILHRNAERLLGLTADRRLP
jgi:uncharacterized protein